MTGVIVSFVMADNLAHYVFLSEHGSKDHEVFVLKLLPCVSLVIIVCVVGPLWAFRRIRQLAAVSSAHHLPDFPRFWGLFSFVLCHETRERVFEPAYQDLLEDFAVAKRERGRWARRWICFAFGVRTMFMVIDCIRVGNLNRLGRFMDRLIRYVAQFRWRQ